MAEDVDHPAIVRLSDRPEARESCARGQKSQSFQKMAANTFALELILNGHRDFRSLVAAADVGTRRNDGVPLTRSSHDHERELCSRIRRVAKRSHEFRRGFGKRKEPVLPGFRRKPVKKLSHGRYVFGHGHTNCRCRAVPQNQPSEFSGILIRGRDVKWSGQWITVHS